MYNWIYIYIFILINNLSNDHNLYFKEKLEYQKFDFTIYFTLKDLEKNHQKKKSEEKYRMI